jgi:hypothetical protein
MRQWEINRDQATFFDPAREWGFYTRICWIVTRPDGVCIHFPKHHDAIDYVSQKNGGVVPEIGFTENGVPNERVED